MLMLDRDGTTLAPARNTSLAGRIANAIVRVGAWNIRRYPSLQRTGKVAQVASLYAPGTRSTSRQHVLRGPLE
jgi:hypothetical protein